VNVRRAAEADEPVLRELWEEFEREVPEPVGEPETWDEEWADTLEDIRGGGVFVAEDDHGVVGVARIEAPVHGRAHLQLIHVRERARREGVAKALLAECARDARERGAGYVTLEVLTGNETARTVWSRLGFEPYSLLAAAPLDRLEARLAPAPSGEHRATIHVQTDDRLSVERAVQGFVPRLEAADVRAGSSWIRIADPLLDRDRDAHARLARELGERLGAVVVALSLEGEVVRFRLYESGRMVDEYLSVPSYYGPLSKGDELALEANPTLVARLTGADREAVRRVARTGATPAELPPAAQLYADLAALMGLEG
jgi:ribosomal protein S18 acetylase RimI-like enzyme